MFRERFFPDPGPYGGKFEQICFVVQDLDRALPIFSTRFGVGPWFVLPPRDVGSDPSTHRGERRPIDARIALGYAGNLMFELVAPNPGSRSIFSEWVQERGYGVHHFGFLVENFDEVILSIERNEVTQLMTSVSSTGARVVMIGGDGPFGAIEELIELRPENAAFYAFMKQAASEWDGETLVSVEKMVR